MANPGFPPQMQMQQPPGMMPQRPGGPGGIPMAGTVRKGTPKIVPVVVSAGLAVGVFCGLYFGLGTGETNTAEAGTTTAPVKTGVTGPQSAAGATDEKINFQSTGVPPSQLGSGSAATTGSATTPGSGTAPIATGSGSGSAATPGTGSGTTPGTGSGTTPPPPNGEAAVELSFEVNPPDATITIDGEDITGGKITIKFTGDKKTVRLVAKASGYKTYDKKMTVTKDTSEEAIEIKLAKKSSRPRPPGGGGHEDHGHDPPGGLIDL